MMQEPQLSAAVAAVPEDSGAPALTKLQQIFLAYYRPADHVTDADVEYVMDFAEQLLRNSARALSAPACSFCCRCGGLLAPKQLWACDGCSRFATTPPPFDPWRGPKFTPGPHATADPLATLLQQHGRVDAPHYRTVCKLVDDMDTVRRIRELYARTVNVLGDLMDSATTKLHPLFPDARRIYVQAHEDKTFLYEEGDFTIKLYKYSSGAMWSTPSYRLSMSLGDLKIYDRDETLLWCGIEKPGQMFTNYKYKIQLGYKPLSIDGINIAATPFTPPATIASEDCGCASCAYFHRVESTGRHYDKDLLPPTCAHIRE